MWHQDLGQSRVPDSVGVVLCQAGPALIAQTPSVHYFLGLTGTAEVQSSQNIGWPICRIEELRKPFKTTQST